MIAEQTAKAGRRAMVPPPHVTVCICTYKRPEMLARLLEHLSRQVTEGVFNFSVVVVDNDTKESARAAVEKAASQAGYKLVYCVEPIQNIARARNRALQQVTGDLAAFIDDDQFPHDSWLLTLFRALQEDHVDGVLGPVLPHYEVPPPLWVLKGRFHERPTYPTGLVIDWKKGRTGNVLLKMKVCLTTPEPFDPVFITGEDQDFFRRKIEEGFRFIWCNEAVAYETVPPVRWSKSFLIRRALLRGKISLSHRNERGGLILKSLVAAPLYGVALPICLLLGKHVFFKYLIKLCDHAGRLLTAAGIDVVEDHYITG